MPTVIKKLDANSFQLKDQVVAINRVTKVVKGGKNLSFAALVVVGDPSAAVVGHGAGKAKEVPQAIRKAIGTLWLRQSFAEAGSGRHGSDCRGRGARGDDLGGNPERVDQVDRHHQPAQRDQSDFRRAPAFEEQGECRRHARQVSAGTVTSNGTPRKNWPLVTDHWPLRVYR
jgi:hypothetical protein